MADAKKQDTSKKREHPSTRGFITFIRQQGVIGLAVGLAIGAAAGDTVRKLVEGFINPIVQFIVGSQDALATATWHIELFGRNADFKWGRFCIFCNHTACYGGCYLLDYSYLTP